MKFVFVIMSKIKNESVKEFVKHYAVSKTEIEETYKIIQY